MTETQEQQAKKIERLRRVVVGWAGDVCDQFYNVHGCGQCSTCGHLQKDHEPAKKRRADVDALIAALRSQVQTETTPEVAQVARELHDAASCLSMGGYSAEYWRELARRWAIRLDAVLRSAPALTQGEHDHGAELIGQAIPDIEGTEPRLNEGQLFHAFEAGWDAFEGARAHRKSQDAYDAAFKSAWASYLRSMKVGSGTPTASAEPGVARSTSTCPMTRLACARGCARFDCQLWDAPAHRPVGCAPVSSQEQAAELGTQRKDSSSVQEGAVDAAKKEPHCVTCGNVRNNIVHDAPKDIARHPHQFIPDLVCCDNPIDIDDEWGGKIIGQQCCGRLVPNRVEAVRQSSPRSQPVTSASIEEAKEQFLAWIVPKNDDARRNISDQLDALITRVRQESTS